MPGGRANKFLCGKSGSLSQKQGDDNRTRAERGRGGDKRGYALGEAIPGLLHLGGDGELLQGLDMRNLLNL